MKTLLIDIGNTFLKTASVRNGKPVSVKTLKTSSIAGIKSILVSKKVSLCVCCSVVPEVTEKLKKICRKLGIRIYFLTHRDIEGIKLKYNSPENIGADRIASIMGAQTHCRPPFIIVDTGSAVTCELVDKNGIYRGGVIFPGIDLSLNALKAGTALLPAVKFSRPRSGPGANTPECIKKGVWAAMSGGIEKTVTYFLKKEPGAAVFLTGAGGKFFRSGDLPFQYRNEPLLVFQGLLQFYKKLV